jgi:hypothetical protein
MTAQPSGAVLTRGRGIVSIGAIVVVASSLLQWWQIGGGPGELPVWTDKGISDGRVFLMFLAAAACLLLVTLRLVSESPVPVDRPPAYLLLFAVALAGYGLRVADLAARQLVPWPPARGAGFWLAAAGLAVLSVGVLELFRERRREPAGHETAPNEAAVNETAAHEAAANEAAAPAADEAQLEVADEAQLEVADEAALDEPESGEDSDPLTQPRYVPGWVMRAWHRLARPPAFPDRSAALDSEPRGRLDRTDIWVVVALIVVILSMRVYRLGEPTQMYFDEVYHARTATEFLQEWRYGIQHDIFEWTHPHLAKYAIAGGITLFSDDKVTAAGSLDVPVKAAVVQQRTVDSPGATTPDPNAQTNYGTLYGDRIFVATGSEVRAYDLGTRALAHTYSIAGASALSGPSISGLIYVGTSDGRVYSIDTNSLDDLRAGATNSVKAAVQLSVSTGLSIAHIFVGSPPYILVSDATGSVVSIDLTAGGGTIVGRGAVPGAADFAALGAGPTIVTADPSRIQDAIAEAQTLADLVGIDAAPVQESMSSTGGLEVALPLGSLTTDQITSIRDEIDSGALPGVDLADSTPEVLVAYRNGVGVLDARHLVINSTIDTDSPATSIALNPDAIRQGIYRYYVTAGDSLLLVGLNASSTPYAVSLEGDQPLKKMPGEVTQVVFDDATKVAQVLGRTPDGTGWTVYAIETNGNAVFSDARLPFAPVAIGVDNAVQVRGIDDVTQMPGADREALLAFAPDGSTASVDVGQFAFSWRIVGVLFGALTAVCLYLLARILFRRRSVGLLIAFFSLVDGMLFAQSRIAMNDTYVGGFLLLAYLIFAVIWLKVWKNRFVFWLGMPLLGVVLGLALVSKWVAFYAIASIGVLILIRSALGRLVTILGLAAGTGVLGWMAIAEMAYEPGTGNAFVCLLLLTAAALAVCAGIAWAARTRLTPDKVFVGVATAAVSGLLLAGALLASPGSLDNGAPNYTFFVVMLAVTCLAAAGNAYRPVAWTREELYFAIGAPPVVGLVGPFALALLLVPFGLPFNLQPLFKVALEAGAAGLGVGIMAGATFWVAGRVGLGPLAVAPRPDSPAAFAERPSPAPEGWLRLGSGFGVPAAWTAFCIAVLPFLVYIVLYIPWSMPWQQQTAATGPEPAIACWSADAQSGACLDAWPAGHTGQTLWDLTIAMYNYHDTLRLPHQASSPWWAWPLDLKPVWFASGSDVPGMFSWIHDGGNPALWWMAIAGMAFISWQAFKRRNLGLALIAVAFFWQWLSWSRIDRAAFQYHFYTALPFFLLGLAYLLAEVWHGPSRRTWLLARVAGAAALLTPGVLWLLKPGLCGLARVDTTEYFGSTVCGTATGDVVITTRVFLIAAVLVAALLALALLLWRSERRQAQGFEDRGRLVAPFVPTGIAVVLIWWLGIAAPNDVLIHEALPSDSLTFLPVTVGVLGSYFALTARNPRRFVLGVCAIATLVFAFMYPDLSALWLPNTIQGIYSVTSPTWMYGFQFATNQQVSATVKIVSLDTLTAVAAAVLLAGIAAWVGWERREVVGWRRFGLLRGSGSGGDAGGSDSAGDGADPEDAEADPAGGFDSSPLP